MNKILKVLSLKGGKKLEVTFYNNRVIGENQIDWSRHLGRIVCDLNIYPIRVTSWKKIDKTTKNHMWTLVKIFLL